MTDNNTTDGDITFIRGNDRIRQLAQRSDIAGEVAQIRADMADADRTHAMGLAARCARPHYSRPRCSEQGQSLLEFGSQDLAGSLAISDNHGVDEGGMRRVAVVDVGGAETQQLNQFDEPSAQSGNELREQPVEHRVACGCDNGHVQGDVGIDEGLVAAGRRLPSSVESFSQGVHLQVGAPLRGQPHRLYLHEHPHLVDVRHRGAAQHFSPVLCRLHSDDEHAGSLSGLHQTRSGECAQRLANGGASDSKGRRKRGLPRQSGTDGPLAAGDLFT